MTVNTELIVLHTTKFGENSVVLHSLSRNYGRRSFMVKGVGSKVQASLLLPLNILEADVTETSRSTLYTARNLTCRHPLNSIRNNLYKNSMTMFISEVLYRVVKDGTDEPGLYESCVRDILLLDAVESDFANFHIRFLLQLAVDLGFSPDRRGLEPFAGSSIDILESFLNSSFEQSMLIPLSGKVRNEMAESLLRYLEHHTDSAINVNSLRVLRELFA